MLCDDSIREVHMATTDCSGSGATELHAVVINEEEGEYDDQKSEGKHFMIHIDPPRLKA